MLTKSTPRPRLTLREVDSNAEDLMDTEPSTSSGQQKCFAHVKHRPHGENQPLSLTSPDPSDYIFQQALLHSPQFDGSPDTVLKLKLAYLGFKEGSPPDGKPKQVLKVILI